MDTRMRLDGAEVSCIPIEKLGSRGHSLPESV
jgi:hypothetical protein